MKKFFYILFFISFLFTITSCSKYLEVELQNQMTMDEVFNKRQTTEAYLAQIYGFLPNESDMIGGEGGMVPLSDEALFSWTAWVPWININNGSWGTTNGDYHTWAHNYRGIKQATIFLENVDKNVEISQQNKDVMKAEARFLRAYFYYSLVKRYGPVYIWGDQDTETTIKGEDIDRHPLQVNIDFIVSEIDKSVDLLPLKITDPAWYGRITKGAALATKSELLLYMARPLYNGSKYHAELKNKDGEPLFPQSTDLNKWESAAKASKDLIDLNQYKLYEATGESDPVKKAIKSYMGVFHEDWNEEIIWGRWINNGFDVAVRAAPPRVLKEGYGGYSPSLKLVDTYPMASTGRYPITAYQANGEPIIDNKSGYVETGFTDGFIHPLDDFAAIKAHNSYVGRDARFYASVLASGMYWINRFHGDKLVTFFTGGTSSYTQTGDCIKTGYIWRRMSNPANDIEEGKWGHYTWPFYRLAEIYLNYAEACNEKPNRQEAEALTYINLVRKRSGLNKLEEAYPEVKGNKELLRTLLQKERMVELAFEGNRYQDVRTWMIAEKEMNEPFYTRNLASTTYEGSWSRTTSIFPGKRVFQPKHYFFPIHQDQLSEMTNITQNYGW